HDRLGAGLAVTRLCLFADADEPLLLRLAVRMLNEDREQLQCIALRDRRPAGSRIDQIQFRPRPADDFWSLQVPAGNLSLDRREFRVLDVRGAATADDTNRIHPFRIEPECPKKPARCHLGEYLTVLPTVLDLQLVVRRDHAGELWR